MSCKRWTQCCVIHNLNNYVLKNLQVGFRLFTLTSTDLIFLYCLGGWQLKYLISTIPYLSLPHAANYQSPLNEAYSTESNRINNLHAQKN